MAVLNGSAFALELAHRLRLEGEDRFDLTVGLFDEWGIDSLQAFEMIVIIEFLAAATVPPPELPDLFTVGDAYEYYLMLVDAQAGRDA